MALVSKLSGSALRELRNRTANAARNLVEVSQAPRLPGRAGEEIIGAGAAGRVVMTPEGTALKIPTTPGEEMLRGMDPMMQASLKQYKPIMENEVLAHQAAADLGIAPPIKAAYLNPALTNRSMAAMEAGQGSGEKMYRGLEMERIENIVPQSKWTDEDSQNYLRNLMTLHDSGMVKGDPNSGNVIVGDIGGKRNSWLIDFAGGKPYSADTAALEVEQLANQVTPGVREQLAPYVQQLGEAKGMDFLAREDAMDAVLQNLRNEYAVRQAAPAAPVATVTASPEKSPGVMKKINDILFMKLF